MASKPKTTPDEGEDDELPLTTLGDKLVNLPDESVVDVEVSDLSASGKEDDEDKGGSAEPLSKKEESADDGSQETLAALQKRIDEQNRTSAERIRVAEQNAENERQARLRDQQTFQQRHQRQQDENAQRELVLLTQNIETSNGQLESLQDELARQNEAGEFKEAAKTQGKIAKLAASIDRMETEKATFEANLGQTRESIHEGAVQPPGGKVEQREQVPIGQQLERWLSTLDPPAAKWIREHPDCAPPNLGGTTSGYNKMMAGHWAAQAAGTEINSPDYFKTIEEHTGHRQKEAAPGQQQRRAQPGGRRVIPGAPPSRDVPGNVQTPGRTRQVRLNKEQQEHALLAFPHLKPQEALAAYARNLVELEAEGKMGRTNV